MTATSQLFMRYKIYESYCVFNGEFYEYIKNFQNLKKKTNTENQIHFIQKTSQTINFLFKLLTARKQ